MDIRLEHVSVTYGKGKNLVPALCDVSCVFHSGKVNCLVGASGSGKSTLLRYVARLLPGEGQLWFDEVDVTHALPQNLSLAYVNQEVNLPPNLTVFDQLAFPLKTKHASRSVMIEKVEEMAATLSLTPCLGVLPRYLSLGQQRLVMLGKAFLREADLLLLDEPFANLDPQTQESFLKRCLQFQQKQKSTLVLVSHQEELLAPYMDYFVWLEKGRVLGEGNRAHYQSSWLRFRAEAGGNI